MITTLMTETQNQDGMPWWVKAITFFGVPSAIAMYLVYILANNISGSIHSISNTLLEHNSMTAALVRQIEEEHSTYRLDSSTVRRILLANCVNSATSEMERNRCVGIEPVLGGR